MRRTPPKENEVSKRTSIWSVSEGWLTAYFLLFTIQFIIGLSLVIWYEVAFVTDDSAIKTMMNILGRAATIPILSASISYIIVEGGRLTMVIANWVEKKLEERRTKREEALLERGREEGRAEGIEIGHKRGRDEGITLGRELERKEMSEKANGNGAEPKQSNEE